MVTVCSGSDQLDTAGLRVFALILVCCAMQGSCSCTGGYSGPACEIEPGVAPIIASSGLPPTNGTIILNQGQPFGCVLCARS